MKILVLHDADGRIDIMEVAYSIIKEDYEEDIELFLSKQGYSIGNITWMAGYTDFIPVTYHKFEVDEKGEITHECRESRIDDYSIDDEYTLTKDRETEELYQKVMNYGKVQKNGNKEVTFTEDNPVVAGYADDNPCDIFVKKVYINANYILKIFGCDKEGCSGDREYDVNDIFMGHLSYISSAIGTDTKGIDG